MKKIVFAGGCFWGIEAYFAKIAGVIQTKVGYANGTGENPSYEAVCTGITGYVESCEISYDPSIITLSQLIQRLWRIIDPTLIDRQGPDIGSQYRTGIYYIDLEDQAIIQLSIDEVSKNYKLPIMTENLPLKNFYEAESYHQKYLEKNPSGYCHINLDA